MARKKWKRKGGYTSPKPTMSIKDLIKNNLFLERYYDDWQDWRDGLRDYLSDWKTIKRIPPQIGRYLKEEVIKKRIRMNEKQKRLTRKRKKQKLHQKRNSN